MKLLCYGDSNTYGYDPRACLGDRYPETVRWTGRVARQTGWDVVNAGLNGRKIPDPSAADRLLSVYGPADILSVLLGTNDLLQGRSAPRTTERMEAFLTPLIGVYPQILLIAPPRLRPGAWVQGQRQIDASCQLAGLYADLARRLGVRFADAQSWEIDVVFDGVHFSEEGHRAFAAGLLAALEAD